MSTTPGERTRLLKKAREGVKSPSAFLRWIADGDRAKFHRALDEYTFWPCGHAVARRDEVWRKAMNVDAERIARE